ncbi:zinc finger protein weckle [Drosophila virilis]|uniref:Zinc finger protein weckle n=1 Tax=Drosophila virilis TaxID=7244 RepID=B4M422_DROVI|nr:zinc finger protein weckle [Drosophila virilis]EDW59383.1 uncharacterized protein Dvir_GJ10854 [Drosophila virilis]
MAEHCEAAIGDSHWLNWCRLCAKDDARGNVKIYTSANENTWNSILVMAIRKYFDVHMQLEDALGGVLCKECYTLVSELIDFAEHVTKVQAIFEVLRLSEPNKQLDMEALRQQYGLREGDWTHIIKPVSELENNTAKQISADIKTISAELPNRKLVDLDNGLDGELPKREFVDLGAGLESEVTKPLQNDEEMIVSHLPIEEIEAHDNPIRPRTRRKISKLPKTYLPEKTVRKRKVKWKDEPKVDKSGSKAGKGQRVLPEHTEEGLENSSPSLDANLEYLPDVAAPPTSSVRPGDNLANSDREDVESENENSDIPSKRSNMKCKWCGKMYHNPASYQKHLRVVCRKIEQRPRMDKNTFCELCNKTLSSPAALRLHKEGMHENAKPYVCDHCGKQLKTITALNEHKLVHTEDRPFTCSICKAGFKNRARLKVHYQIHEEPSYVCNICGKKLQTRRTWNMHKLVHSEERKFKCDVCGALFKRSKTLKSHLLSHTGLRPYVCKYCGQTFACNANCRAHKLKKHPLELKKEEGEAMSSRLSVPTLEELRVMSQKIPKLEPDTSN